MVNLTARALSLVAAALALWLPAAAQQNRARAEIDLAGEKVVVQYGTPQLKGRDPLTWQQDGQYWRMGSNEMTTLATTSGLAFGSTVVPRGVYGLWLHRIDRDSYEMVFNREVKGHGMSHNKDADVAAVPLKKAAVAGPVETLLIELMKSGDGGTFVMTWGTTALSADFRTAK